MASVSSVTPSPRSTGFAFAARAAHIRFNPASGHTALPRNPSGIATFSPNVHSDTPFFL